MGKFIHKILYRTLPLEGYLRAVSRLFFLWQRLGIGREAPATEYVYHLPKLIFIFLVETRFHHVAQNGLDL